MKGKITGLLCIVLVLSMTLLSGCGSASQVDMKTLQTDMLAADDSLPDMTTVNSDSENAEDLFAYLSDVDYKKVNSFFLSYASEGTAEEIAVVELKSEKNADDMVSSLKEHQEGRVNLYKSYAPDQVDAAENAIIYSKGSCVVYIACPNQEAVKKVFENEVK